MTTPGLPDGWRQALVDTVIYHYQTGRVGVWANPCRCGHGTRSEDLGKSHAEHVADVFEQELTYRLASPPDL